MLKRLRISMNSTSTGRVHAPLMVDMSLDGMTVIDYLGKEDSENLVMDDILS